MITFEEAYRKTLETATILGVEEIDFLNSLGWVLAKDVVSDMNMPPFDKSAMDGYACRKQDLANELDVIEIIPAGVFPSKVVGLNQCAKIMTGAPVPKGADTVIMVEHTRESSLNKIRFTAETSKSNICYLAEDIKTGDVVLKKGTLIKPKHIPVLASVGATRVEVYKKPKVAIISTGDELVEPQIMPKPSQIRNSNAFQLMAAAAELGLEYSYLGIAKDSIESVDEKLKMAIEKADVILLSGAVSMGDFDFVPLVLKEAGIDIKFHGVDVKPGKRSVFGTSKNKWYVGVPGNPVSAFVQFETLVKPLLLKIMGRNKEEGYLKLTLGEDFIRNNAGRKAFEPIVIDREGFVRNMEYHGSAHINALSYADGLMIFEKGVFELKKGEKVNVRPL